MLLTNVDFTVLPSNKTFCKRFPLAVSERHTGVLCRLRQAPGSEDLSQHLAWGSWSHLGWLECLTYAVGRTGSWPHPTLLSGGGFSAVLMLCPRSSQLGGWELRTHIWLLLSRESRKSPSPACLQMDVIDSKVDRCPGTPHLLSLGAPPSPPAGQPPWSGVQACAP